MAEECVRYFAEAERLGGIPAKVRLAALARVTSSEAGVVADDREVLGRLERAMGQLKIELNRRPSGAYKPVTTPASSASLAGRLRRQLEACADLISQRSQILGDTEETARRVTETAGAVLDVARISVWLLNVSSQKLTCIDLFDRMTRRHTAGSVLRASECRGYFEALATERTVMVNDALQDPRTRCLGDRYLAPQRIGALLDVPFFAPNDPKSPSAGDRMCGIVRLEHVGGRRSWDLDEERFAYLIAGFVALAVEREASGMHAEPVRLTAPPTSAPSRRPSALEDLYLR